MTRPAFPLRFKDPATKEMLRLVSDQLGVPMSDLAEDAIRNELVVLGAHIERQLTEIVIALRSYDPQTDLDAYLDEFAAGEIHRDPVQAQQLPASPKPHPGRAGAGSPKVRRALAAFKQ